MYPVKLLKFREIVCGPYGQVSARNPIRAGDQWSLAYYPEERLVGIKKATWPEPVFFPLHGIECLQFERPLSGPKAAKK
ncbi:MAG: hypothetical protein D6746_03200 [Bacteroidetes bacterium]|nr:MAG: hypothetical protein D6746_03200 [Bacteroidota bacterium]